jgi:hypothetical protein
MRTQEYVIKIVDSNLYYKGSNFSNEDITREHFGEIEEVFTYDSYEEAESVIKDIDIYEPLTIIKIYR